MSTQQHSKQYTVLSPYRPLTRNARDDLKDYNIVDSVKTERSRSDALIVSERPADEILDRHELEVEQDPAVAYETDHGEDVAIYLDPDRVINEGVEATLTPYEAVEIAEKRDGWEVVEGDPANVTDAIPEVVAENTTLPGDFEFKTVIWNPHMADDTIEPSGPLYVWERENENGNNTRIGYCPSEDYADEGYPFAVLKRINYFDDRNPAWKHTHIAPTPEDALKALEQSADFRTFIVDSEGAEVYHEWEERTGGTDYNPPPAPWEDDE